MPPSFSSTLRACAMAVSTSALHFDPSLPLAQDDDRGKNGLGCRLLAGFLGGTMPLCAAALTLAPMREPAVVLPGALALASVAPGPISAIPAGAGAPSRIASRTDDMPVLLRLLLLAYAAQCAT